MFGLAALQVFIEVSGEYSTEAWDYWRMHDTARDVQRVLLACAAYSATPFSRLRDKTLWAGVAGVFLVLVTLNTIFEFTTLEWGGGAFLAFAVLDVVAVLWVARYLVWFRPTRETPGVNRLSIIIGRPRTLSGLLIAAWSGQGGSFAATDGVHVWRFRRYSGQFEKSLLTADYLRGKMALDRGAITPAHYEDLAAMISTKWTLFTNCYSLLRRWV
jgi:hypothetical protein